MSAERRSVLLSDHQVEVGNFSPLFDVIVPVLDPSTPIPKTVTCYSRDSYPSNYRYRPNNFGTAYDPANGIIDSSDFVGVSVRIPIIHDRRNSSFTNEPARPSVAAAQLLETKAGLAYYARLGWAEIHMLDEPTTVHVQRPLPEQAWQLGLQIEVGNNRFALAANSLGHLATKHEGSQAEMLDPSTIDYDGLIIPKVLEAAELLVARTVQ